MGIRRLLTYRQGDLGEHGIVMCILYDIREVNTQRLEEWEAGDRGPILE
jgi:hypothetical protein